MDEQIKDEVVLGPFRAELRPALKPEEWWNIRNPTGMIVAFVQTGMMTNEQQAATARLLAASWNLLNACKDSLIELEAAGASELTVGRVKAAIAEAEGRGE